MKNILCIISLSVLFNLTAKTQFTLDGEFRSRFELRDGYRELASDNTYNVLLVSQRSRLVASYKDAGYSFKFSAQDARIWGQNWGNVAGNTLHIYEAWGSFKPHKNLQVKLGRQELKYDDQRVMSTRNYSLSGITYDAALVTYTCSDNDLSVQWGSLINNPNDTRFLNNFNNPFKYASFLWGEKKFSDKVQINTLYFVDVNQNPTAPEKMYARSTIGGNGIFTLSDKFGGRFGGYYQFGKQWINIGSGLINNEMPISAFAYNANLWVAPTMSIKLSATIDSYSGHDWSGSNAKFGGYNRLLASGHGHLGFIDYFTSIDLQEVKWAGINNFFVTADFSINPKFKVQAICHWFWLNKKYFPALNINGYDEVKKQLGNEFDLVAKYKISQAISLEAAFMFMLPSKTLEGLKLSGTKAEFSYFSYFSFLFTPRFMEWQKPKPPAEG